MSSFCHRVSLVVLTSLLITTLGSTTGCTPTSMYKKAAMIGVKMVGDTIAEDEATKELSAVSGSTPAQLDQRYGPPRGVFLDTQSGREVRVYNVPKDIRGNQRWVIELQGGRADALSKAAENPELGKDAAKAFALEEMLKGKTPTEVREVPVMDKLIFKSEPRILKRVPAGELVQIYDVTSHLDITGSRFVVLGYDKAGRCDAVRFVGTP